MAQSPIVPSDEAARLLQQMMREFRGSSSKELVAKSRGFGMNVQWIKAASATTGYVATRNGYTNTWSVSTTLVNIREVNGETLVADKYYPGLQTGNNTGGTQQFEVFAGTSEVGGGDGSGTGECGDNAAAASVASNCTFDVNYSFSTDFGSPDESGVSGGLRPCFHTGQHAAGVSSMGWTHTLDFVESDLSDSLVRTPGTTLLNYSDGSAIRVIHDGVTEIFCVVFVVDWGDFKRAYLIRHSVDWE